MKTISLAVIALGSQLLTYAVLGYFASSFLTSGFKVLNKDCSKRYQIEEFIHGSLFCE